MRTKLTTLDEATRHVEDGHSIVMSGRMQSSPISKSPTMPYGSMKVMFLRSISSEAMKKRRVASKVSSVSWFIYSMNNETA